MITSWGYFIKKWGDTMPDITISVAGKIATLTNTPTIVCGNSDYTAKFTFDEEFSAYTQKTLRINFREKGQLKHYDILFEGNEVALPAVYAVDAISLGVVAGNVLSTTPVVIPCLYGDSAVHDDPPPDIYEQLLTLIEGMGNSNVLGVAYDLAAGFTSELVAGSATETEG